MSGAQRRAEEQGYYVNEDDTTAKTVAPSPAVSLREVCAKAGHELSPTAGMKSCACGEKLAPKSLEEPESLF